MPYEFYSYEAKRNNLLMDAILILCGISLVFIGESIFHNIAGGVIALIGFYYFRSDLYAGIEGDR